MIYVMNEQGPWSGGMATYEDTPIQFQVPSGGMILVMGQVTVQPSDSGSGYHTAGATITVYDDAGQPRGSGNSSVKLQNPSHGSIPLVCVHAEGLNPGTMAKITIAKSSGSNGGPGSDDYYSIAVVELEQTQEGSRPV
jgi:hypothetical protein